MPMDASASLMHRRYRLYTTRLAERDSELYPIVEEQEPRPRRWAFYALVACSFAFIVLLGGSAVYSQPFDEDDKRNTRSYYRFPKFDKRNRYVVCRWCHGTISGTFSHLSCITDTLSKRNMDTEIVVMACIPSVLFSVHTSCLLLLCSLTIRDRKSMKLQVLLW